MLNSTNFMKKHIATAIAGVFVLLLTIYPLVVPVEHLSWLRWKITIAATSAIALVALLFQVFFTMQSENAQEKREQDRDKALEEIAKKLTELTSRTNNQVAQKAAETAYSLAASLTKPRETWLELLVSRTLYEFLLTAYNVQGKTYQSEAHNPISKGEVRREAESLILTTIENLKSEQAGEATAWVAATR